MPDLLLPYDWIVRIVIIGELETGKSKLLLRFTKNRYVEEHYAKTSGVDFGTLTIKEKTSEVRIKALLWDTSGAQGFINIVSKYSKDADAAICVFDLTNSKSLENLTVRIAKFRKQAPTAKLILLGNKSDIKNDAIINDAQIEEFVKENQIDAYFPVSAKTGENVENAFCDAINRAFEHKSSKESIHNTESSTPPAPSNPESSEKVNWPESWPSIKKEMKEELRESPGLTGFFSGGIAGVVVAAVVAGIFLLNPLAPLVLLIGMAAGALIGGAAGLIYGKIKKPSVLTFVTTPAVSQPLTNSPKPPSEFLGKRTGFNLFSSCFGRNKQVKSSESRPGYNGYLDTGKSSPRPYGP